MSASARTARMRDKVISRGFKVQNTNHVAATSLMRGVDPCLTNYEQLVYKLPTCQKFGKSCSDQNIVVYTPVPFCEYNIPVYTPKTGSKVPITNTKIEILKIYFENPQQKPYQVDQVNEAIDLQLQFHLPMHLPLENPLCKCKLPTLDEPHIPVLNLHKSIHISEPQTNIESQAIPKITNVLPIRELIFRRPVYDGGLYDTNLKLKFDGASPFASGHKLYDGGGP